MQGLIAMDLNATHTTVKGVELRSHRISLLASTHCFPNVTGDMGEKNMIRNKENRQLKAEPQLDSCTLGFYHQV